MPPGLGNSPQQRNMSPRNDLSLFYCRICKERFTHHNEIEAHRSSKDHLHRKQLKDMRTEARELAATKPDEPLLVVHYAERDEWSEMWPQRLLFVPEMKSYERGDGNWYGSVCEPRYNILSYTWGRWQDTTGQVRSLELEGIEWKIPAIQPHIFTVDEFTAVIHEISSDVEWVWVDVACIDQSSSDILSTKARDEEVGRQAGIFARASSTFVWLHQSPIEKLQRFADELFGLSARCAGDDKHVLDTAMGSLDVHFGVDYEGGIFPSCVLDMGWLEKVGQSLSILEDEPWFSSLWTLQESLLQPMATILSREGQQLSRQGYLEVGLANFLASWGNIENALERSADIIATSAEECRTAVADILARMEALGLKSHDNPVLVYSIAGYRKTLHEEDRIYGIMQLFGLKLGKSSNPGVSFSLSELEVQFAAAINKKSPVWAQLFVHGMKQPAGRHWCINQSCRLPHCVNIIAGIAKSQCHISVDANGQASFKGSYCSFEQLQAAWDSTRKGPFIRTIWTTETSSGQFPVGVILLDENDEFLSTIPKDLHRIEDELDFRHRELGALLVREHGGDLRILYCGTIDNENVEYSSEEEWEDYKGTEENNYASVGILAIPVSRSGITFWQRVGICFWTRLPELHASSISWMTTTAILD